jgi:hypothetical protein
MSGSDLFIPRNETARSRYFQNIIIMFCLPISTFMYSYLWATYRQTCSGNFYIAHRYINIGIGNEGAQFQYINRIFGTV